MTNNFLLASAIRKAVFGLAISAAIASTPTWAGDADLDPDFGGYNRESPGLLTTALGGTGDYAAGITVYLEDAYIPIKGQIYDLRNLVYSVGQLVDKSLGNRPYLVLTDTRGNPEDTIFGWSDGKRKLIEYSINSLRSVLVQQDGKLLLLDSNFTVSRWWPDGTLDQNFGDAGYARINFPPTSGIQTGLASEFALQYDGHILVAGTVVYQANESDIAVMRYNPDGTPDKSFGKNGLSVYKKPGLDTGDTIASNLSNSRVLVGGSRSGQPIVLRVLNKDGAFSHPYDSVANVSTTGRVTGLAFQPNDNAVAAVVGSLNAQEGVFTMRYTTKGRRDAHYIQPMVGMYIPLNSDARILLQPDGRIIVGTTVLHTASSKPNDTDIALIRYKANGDIDPAFIADSRDLDPKVIFANQKRKPIQYDFNGEDRLNRLTLQWDGKILAAGRLSKMFGIARLMGNNVDTLPSPIDNRKNTGQDDISVFRDMVSVHNLDDGVKVPMQMICMAYDSSGHAVPAPNACQYRLNELGNFISAPRWVKNGDTMIVRHVMENYDKIVSTFLIGGMLAPNNNQVTLGTAVSATYISCRAATCN